MSQYVQAAYQNLQDLIPLTLTIHSKRQVRPQKWVFRSGKISKFAFSHNPLAVKQLKYSYKSFLCSLLSVKNLKILQKRRTLPYFGCGIRNEIQSLTVSKLNFIPEKRDMCLSKHITDFSARCLKKIFKEAKNLKSLVLEPECEGSNFKSIRKARRLKNLTITIEKEQILGYPGLFKGLTSLEKVTLSLQFSFDKDTKVISKFFGFLLNLPKLQHLTVWLENSLDYFKTLLYEIHQKKLSSFLLIVFDTFIHPSEMLKSKGNLGNWIDALYIGRIETLEVQKQYWPAPKEPERRLVLNDISRVNDLINENTTIKTLDIMDFYSNQESSSIKKTKSLLSFISRMKALENLTVVHKTSSKNYNQVISDFHNKLGKIESLENLKTFIFQLQNKSEDAPMILPPYSSRMKNLRTLNISIEASCFYLFDLHNFTEDLKNLKSLENLYFEYYELAPSSLKVHCNLPLECLPNLRSISLHCSDSFEEKCLDELFQKICRLKNLESLEISGGILQKLDRKKATVLVEDLCEKKNLEIVKFTWWRPGSCEKTIVSMQKIKKEKIKTIKGKDHFI